MTIIPITLKASNFIDEGIAGGLAWNGRSENDRRVPKEMKRRYVRYFGGCSS